MEILANTFDAIPFELLKILLAKIRKLHSLSKKHLKNEYFSS